MTEVKAMILGQILKQNGPFKPRHIYHPIGVTRQACNPYLKRFVEEGVLYRQGEYYVVDDKDAVLNALVETKEPVTPMKLQQTRLLRPVKQYNDLISAAVVARTLDLPGSMEIRQSLLLEIDKSIQTMKNAKRYITSAQTSRNSAKKQLKNMDIWELFDSILEGLVPKNEFEAIINDIENEE